MPFGAEQAVDVAGAEARGGLGHLEGRTDQRHPRRQPGADADLVLLGGDGGQHLVAVGGHRRRRAGLFQAPGRRDEHGDVAGDAEHRRRVPEPWPVQVARTEAVVLGHGLLVARPLDAEAQLQPVAQPGFIAQAAGHLPRQVLETARRRRGR